MLRQKAAGGMHGSGTWRESTPKTQLGPRCGHTCVFVESSGERAGDPGHSQHLAGEAAAGREGAMEHDQRECAQGENSGGKKDPKCPRARQADEDVW